MSVNFDAAYIGLNAILVAGMITIVVAMASAAIMHGLAKAVVALDLGKLDEQTAPAQGPVDNQTAIAVAIAAAKRYQDTH
jgi:hypothetical protein